MPSIQKLCLFLFHLLLIIFWNLFIIVYVIYNIVRHGRKYLKSPSYYPQPQLFHDPKFGEHKIAHLKDINLHYVVSGDIEKPLILFVHGFPEFWYSWHNQIMEFQKDYRVVAVNLRGYGYSDKPQNVPSVTLDIMVEDLRQLIEHLGASKCILVGHDWGGAISWQMSQTHPDLLSQLVVMNAPHMKALREHLGNSWKQLVLSWYIFFFQMPWLPEWYVSRMDLGFVRNCFIDKKFGLQKRKLTSDELKGYHANMQQPGALTATMNIYRAALRYQSAVEGRRFEVPTLLIWGTEDGALNVDFPKVCEKDCKDLTIKYMTGASHWVQQDMPVEVNAAMREFFCR